MEFDQPKAIYLQISEQIKERIFDGEWKEGERIPSIREMAVNLGVNPNTITRSYQRLMDLNVIENRRGVGYFVCTGAAEQILEELKSDFFGEKLPGIIKTMKKLGISFKDLENKYFNN